ncbi:MAG: hypothetical protein AAFV49_00375 [Pseudomonadota bacterium]
MRFSALLVALFLVSCSDSSLTLRNKTTRVKSQSEAATTHLAVLSRKIYSEDVVKALLPNFTLDGETAFQRSLPLTGDFRALQSRATRASLQVEGRPGTVDAPSTAQDIAAAADPKPLDEAAATLDPADSRTAYSNAIGLFQDVASLNNYVRNYPALAGHTPYIVRLQLAVIPKRRNLPYDVFSDLSFFADLGPRDQTRLQQAIREDDRALADEVQMVPAVPLFATEAAELGRDQQTRATLRTLAASASGQAGIFSLGGGLSDEQKRLIQALTNELNGLFTIGQVTDNVIRVRFGAVQNASSAYEMIPRTHNVTLLLLIPAGANAVNITSKQTMVDVETFEALPPGLNAGRYLTRIDEIFDRFQLAPKPENPGEDWRFLCEFRSAEGKKYGSRTDSKKAQRSRLISFVRKRMRPDVALGDFETFKLRIQRCLERSDADQSELRRLDFADVAEWSKILWTELATVQADLPNSFARFEVPIAPPGPLGKPADSQAGWEPVKPPMPKPQAQSKPATKPKTKEAKK